MRAEILLIALAACGGDDGIDGDSTCGLSLAISGALTDDLDGSADPACLTQHSFDMGVDGELIPFPERPSGLSAVAIDVPDILMGATGSYRAELAIRDGSAAWGAIDCTAEVTEHSEQGPAEMGVEYRVRGSITCPAPLPGVLGDAAGTITLARLEWVYSITWRRSGSRRRRRSDRSRTPRRRPRPRGR